MNDTAGGSGDARVALRARDCELVIFDLDGVLTRTANVHAAAWKALFDDFLDRRVGAGFRPFDSTADYLQHVDGKPRLDGVRDFLASRGLTLEEGMPDDPPGSETVWGLGNAKNRIFNAILERDGVETFAPGVALLEQLRERGIACAVVSASRNCRRILAAAGVAEHADTVLDGNDAAREGLAGKPAPDTFLAAARRLGIPPSRAAVIEDAEAGVAAARAGGFGLVIGVDRAHHAEALRAHGADHVVQRLDQVLPEALPSPLAEFEEVRARLEGRRPALFLDYDGTLTPIVDRPEDAVLDPAMRATLRTVAEHCTVVVVSGRGLEVIRELVAMDQLVYAADHGFQVQCPGEPTMQPELIAGFESLIEAVTERLRARLRQIPGVIVEPKRYSVAVHYRLVAAAAVDGVKETVNEVLAAEPRLRLLAGKKVLELQPDVEWHKGAAVRWVMQRLGLDAAQAVYVGDDVTDESAFRALQGAAITVVVQDTPRPTAAGFRLNGVQAVGRFLQGLGEIAAGRPAP